MVFCSWNTNNGPQVAEVCSPLRVASCTTRQLPGQKMYGILKWRSNFKDVHVGVEYSLDARKYGLQVEYQSSVYVCIRTGHKFGEGETALLMNPGSGDRKSCQMNIEFLFGPPCGDDVLACRAVNHMEADGICRHLWRLGPLHVLKTCLISSKVSADAYLRHEPQNRNDPADFIPML